MFDKLKGQFKQLQMAQQLMKDKDFQALIKTPKIQQVVNDPDVRAAVMSQDFSKLGSNPKLLELMRDPEIATLFSKLDPTKFKA